MTKKQAEVLNYLREHPGSSRDQIAEALGVSIRGIGTRLSALMWDGKLTCSANVQHPSAEDWFYFVKPPRCSSILHQGKRSWRCTRGEGHRGRHLNNAGGRTWA